MGDAAGPAEQAGGHRRRRARGFEDAALVGKNESGRTSHQLKEGATAEHGISVVIPKRVVKQR